MIKAITALEEEIGESALVDFLHSFACPLNPEVEEFLKSKALQSARLSASQTYLLIDEKSYQLQGYYTLVLKTYSVSGGELTSANRRLISRFSMADARGDFHASVFLIAQIGKNDAIAEGQRVSGRDLIGLALDTFREVKQRVGGKLVMVERRKDHEKLVAFYRDNGFQSWTSRIDEREHVEYDQMFAVL